MPKENTITIEEALNAIAKICNAEIDSSMSSRQQVNIIALAIAGWKDTALYGEGYGPHGYTDGSFELPFNL